MKKDKDREELEELKKSAYQAIAKFNERAYELKIHKRLGLASTETEVEYSNEYEEALEEYVEKLGKEDQDDLSEVEFKEFLDSFYKDFDIEEHMSNSYECYGSIDIPGKGIKGYWFPSSIC